VIKHLQQIQGSSEPVVCLEASKQIKIWSRTEWLAEQRQQRQQTDLPPAESTQEDRPGEDTENKAASLQAEIQSAAEEVGACWWCTW